MCPRLPLLTAFATLLLHASPAAAQSASADAFPLRIDRVEIVGRDAELGRLAMARVAPDGSVYAIDSDNTQVVAFSPEGRLLWRSGRKGRGPGEFQMPYRLGVRQDGAVLVLDMTTKEVTTLSPEGRYLERARLPFLFFQPDAVVSLPNGEILVSGTTPDPGAGRYALHRFAFARGEPELKHLGSFGPLPTIRDELVARGGGAGTASHDDRGDIVYVRRFPYEIHRFDLSGRAKGVVRPPVRMQGAPEDAYRIERSAKRTVIENSGVEVTRPGVAFGVGGGWLLSSRRLGPRLTWDLITPGGGYAGSRTLPEGWNGLAGYDARRGVLWLTGTADDEPVLLRVHISVDARAVRSR